MHKKWYQQFDATKGTLILYNNTVFHFVVQYKFICTIHKLYPTDLQLPGSTHTF